MLCLLCQSQGKYIEREGKLFLFLFKALQRRQHLSHEKFNMCTKYQALQSWIRRNNRKKFSTEEREREGERRTGQRREAERGEGMIVKGREEKRRIIQEMTKQVLGIKYTIATNRILMRFQWYQINGVSNQALNP